MPRRGLQYWGKILTLPCTVFVCLAITVNSFKLRFSLLLLFCRNRFVEEISCHTFTVFPTSACLQCLVDPLIRSVFKNTYIATLFLSLYFINNSNRVLMAG